MSESMTLLGGRSLLGDERKRKMLGTRDAFWRLSREPSQVSIHSRDLEKSDWGWVARSIKGLGIRRCAFEVHVHRLKQNQRDFASVLEPKTT